MEVDDWTGPKRDRLFEPRRAPFSPAAKALVAHVQGQMEALEARKRKRRATDQANFERAVAALVSDLAAASLQDAVRWTSVEMSNQKLSAANRRAEYMTERFPEIVRLLADDRLGLAELRTAPPGTRHGLQSTLRALPGLMEKVREAGLTSTAFRTAGRKRKKIGPVLELRGTKVPAFKGGQWITQAPKLELPDTLEVRQLREQMDQVNAWLNTAKLDFYAEPAIDLDIDDRVMKRVFNDGSLVKGGRLYGGFWQQMSADDRLTEIAWVTGEDEADVTASLDFGQSSIRMAYAEVGAMPPKGDLYRLTGAFREWANEREGIKAVMNALLSSDAELGRFPKGTKRLFPKGTKFARVLGDICQHHRPIEDLFGTGRGLDVMYRESQVLLRVLSRLKELSIHALPIHDGILIARGNALLAKSVMEEEFEAVTGAVAVVTMETKMCSPVGPIEAVAVEA